MKALNRRFVLVLLPAFCAGAAAQPAIAPGQGQQLRRMRTEAQETAKLVKSRFRSTATEHLHARRLYLIAQAEVDGVIGFVKQAVLSGQPLEKLPGTELQGAIDRASAATETFINYGYKVTKTADSKGAAAIAAVFGTLVTIGNEIIKGAGATAEELRKVEEYRQRMAAALDAEYGWRAWDDLK